jgi:hypothetical protein
MGQLPQQAFYRFAMLEKVAMKEKSSWATHGPLAPPASTEGAGFMGQRPMKEERGYILSESAKSTFTEVEPAHEENSSWAGGLAHQDGLNRGGGASGP